MGEKRKAKGAGREIGRTKEREREKRTEGVGRRKEISFPSFSFV